MLLDTVHKRKSFTLTCVILSLLILLMLLTGMKYTVPPPERGIAITFGRDKQGSGIKQPAAQAPNPTQEPQLTPNPPEPEPVKTEAPQEKVVTQETEPETVTIPDKPKKQPSKTTPTPQPKKEKPKEKPKPEAPKPSKATTDALANVLGASAQNDSNKGGSQGDDNSAGNKGDAKGNPYSNSYYGGQGGGTSGKGKGWGLNGRDLVEGQKIPQECNEQGKVIVQIEVDRTGKVIRAVPGVKGSTNRTQCLLDAAKKTALTYRWNSDENAPERQIGFIEINFRLGE